MAPPPSPLSSLTSLSDDDAPAAPQPDTLSAPESTHVNPAASRHAYSDEEDLSEAQKKSRRQLVKDWQAEEVAQPSTRCFGCEGAIRLGDVYDSKTWFENEKYCSHVVLLEESGTVARSLSGGKGSLFGGDAARSDDRSNLHMKAHINTASAKAGTSDDTLGTPVSEDTRRQPSRSRPRRNVRRRKNPAQASQQPASAAATLCGGSDSETSEHNKGSNEPNKRELGGVDSLEKPAARKKVSVGRVPAAEGSTKDSSERGADRRDGKQVVPKDEDRIKGARPPQNHRGKVADQHAPCRSKKARDPREAETAQTPVYRDVLVDALPAVIAYSINGVDEWLDLPPLITYAESSMRSTLQDTPTDGA
ncbi:hypothetical protein GGG16DRAFT_121602 [Schizophyllum commune]